jgi:hypothetical protein
MSHTDSYPVLCIEERNGDGVDYKTIINRLFIAYDSEYDSYVVYGKRQNQKVDDDYVPYFFRTDKSADMYNFVKLIVGKKVVCSYTLYNYNNISIDLEDSDYYSMEKNMDNNYDIVSYDMVTIKRNHFRDLMHVLKNVYNFY